MNMYSSLDKKTVLFYVERLLFAMFAFLYLYVSYHSYGYDDEYFNIRQVREHDLWSLVQTIQQTDIHPPLSYIINKVLYSVLQDWTFVRMVSSVLFLTALFFFCRKTKHPVINIFFLLFLGLNPSVLLWTTSIRWYAYVLPLLVLLHMVPTCDRKWYWWYFFSIGWLICMLGYIGFLLLPVYFVYYWIQDRHGFIHKLKRIVLPGSLFILLYAYQFYLFITIHNRTELTGNQQVFDLLASVQSYISSAFSNQGLFPLTFFGILSIAGMLLICLHGLVNMRTYLKDGKFLFLFAALSIITVLTGVAGKIRNLFLLEPSKVSFISIGMAVKPGRWLWILGIFFVLLANLQGVSNVVQHQQTTKNGWNIKMPETLAQLEAIERKNTTTIYFTHHPSFSYHLTNINKQVVSLYNGLYFDSSLITTTVQELDTSKPYDIIFLVNYRGRSISESYFQLMMKTIDTMKTRAKQVDEYNLHEDADFSIKQKFYHDYPRYTTRVIHLKDIYIDMELLSVWERNEY